MNKVYLVGHGNLGIAEFIRLLLEKKVNLLIDVRTWPSSKFAPQFNQRFLKDELAKAEIKYLHMGTCLGGKKDPRYFQKFMQTKEFVNGIEQLNALIKGTTAAIMCSELDHTKCHRRFIGSKLVDKGYLVEPIRVGTAKQEAIAQSTLEVY